MKLRILKFREYVLLRCGIFRTCPGISPTQTPENELASQQQRAQDAEAPGFSNWLPNGGRAWQQSNTKFKETPAGH